jgi:hypothetical protein
VYAVSGDWCSALFDDDQEEEGGGGGTRASCELFDVGVVSMSEHLTISLSHVYVAQLTTFWPQVGQPRLLSSGPKSQEYWLRRLPRAVNRAHAHVLLHACTHESPLQGQNLLLVDSRMEAPRDGSTTSCAVHI